MRILVYPNSLEIGGSLNAIEIAATVRDFGHELTVVGPPGPLVETVARLRLGYVPLDPRVRRRPSLRAAAQLTSMARELRIDLVHGYEWPQIIEACAGPRLRARVPVVATVYSEVVAPFLPVTLPLIVCAPKIADQTAGARTFPISVVRAPVDIHLNAPGADPGPPFRTEFGIEGGPLLVVVTRLADELKLEGLLAACDAMGALVRSGVKAQLAIVGDGPARPQVEQAAAAANAGAGRIVVTLTGELPDPRPAYAAADVILGMGTSALRGMAFSKPVVVQGERGFWELLTPQSAATFLYQGWYGLGPAGHGRGQGAERLAAVLRELLDDPSGLAGLADYGRALVSDQFSVESAAASVAEIYLRTLNTLGPGGYRVAADAVLGWAGAAAHQARRKWRRWRGQPVPADDFNSLEAKARVAGRAWRRQIGRSKCS